MASLTFRRTTSLCTLLALAGMLATLLVGAAPAAAAAHRHGRHAARHVRHTAPCARYHRARRHARCLRRELARRRAAEARASRKAKISKASVAHASSVSLTPASRASKPVTIPHVTVTAGAPSTGSVTVGTGSGSGTAGSGGSGSASAGQTVSCGLGTFSDGAAFNIPSGCWHPFADSSWLNSTLPAAPRLAQGGVDGEDVGSTALVNALMSHGSQAVRDLTPVVKTSWQHAMYFSSPTDPVYTLSCAESTRNCNQVNSAVGEQIHIPCGATVPNGTDMQLFVIDQTDGYEYDLGGLTPGQRLCGGGVFYVSLATKVPLNGDGRFSCAGDAACVGMSAGQIREQELASGNIDHAIFVVDGNCDSSGTPMSLYPADPDNSCSGGVVGAPKEGQWFYLALTDAQIAATGYPAWQQTILRALAHYGMFVGDQGSNGAFDMFTEDQGTYSSFNQANPWVAYAQSLAADPNNHVYADSSTAVDLGMDDIPHSFWVQNLRAVDPCVIQRTCQ